MTEQFWQWFNQGIDQANLENFEEAIASFDEAIKIKPDEYEAWYERGVALTSLERNEEAIASFKETLKLKLDFHDAWYNLGILLANLEKFEEALASYNKAIEIKPDDYEAWYEKGIALASLERNEEAIASFKETLKLKLDFHDAWYNLGILLANLEKFEEALASYNKAIEIKPDEYETWYEKGIALASLERNEEVIASLDKAIKLKLDFHDAWCNLGIVLANLEKFEEAIASYNESIKIQPGNASTWNSRAWALYNLGNFSEAVLSLKKAIEIEPNNYSNWYSRGVALNKLGRFEQAIADFDKALELEPNYEPTWNNRGFSLINLGKYEEAIDCFNKAIDINSNDYHPWINRGLALSRLKKYEEAIASYNKTIELNSDDYKPWADRGIALHNLMQYQEAISSYDKALEIKPDGYNTWINRGVAISNIVKISRSFILPVITSYPDLVITFKNQNLNQGGEQGQFASYEEGFKHCPPETHPEGWGKLHQAIGNAHYFQGCRDENPYPYWYKALKSYENALRTLTQFPEAHLELLQNLIRCLSALGKTSEAEEIQRRATDILQKLLENTPSPTKKQQLALKFAGFQQLTVDLAIQSGNWCAALELAEKGKNACLNWLLYSLGNEISSPTYSEIQKLLNPTTAIIYWHISPNALNTFILKHNIPSPIVLSPQISVTNSLEENQVSDKELPTTVRRHRDFEGWVQNWNKQYTNYRQGKNDREEGEATWRDRLPEELEDLGEILDINAIITAILSPREANTKTPHSEASTIQNLILIPHQDLHRFPLHALFPEQFTVTYLPSAKIGLSLGEREPQNTGNNQLLLSVAAPDSADIEGKKFAQLRHAEMESAIISQMFANPHRLAGRDATKENVQKALASGYKFFNFTGHGTYNFPNPKQSSLALSDTERLTLEDILQLPLNKYHMVSLSACETAITGSQTITTEYVGLVSGFISKGVTNIISTLWSVESISSALFAIEFYRQPDRDTAPSTALKRTQIWLRSVTYSELVDWYKQRAEEVAEKDSICAEDLLDEAAIIKDDPGKINTTIPPYTHPYYWAGFTITGKIDS